MKYTYNIYNVAQQNLLKLRTNRLKGLFEFQKPCRFSLLELRVVMMIFIFLGQALIYGY